MKVFQVPPGKLEKSLQNFQADILQPGIHPKFCFWGFNMFDLSRGAYYIGTGTCTLGPQNPWKMKVLIPTRNPKQPISNGCLVKQPFPK